jgi:hypothetical protein
MSPAKDRAQRRRMRLRRKNSLSGKELYIKVKS